MLFPEACTKLSDYESFFARMKNVDGRDIPILANITEFGQTPLFNTKQLGQVGVSMVLYPLSAFRAMSKAAFSTYKTIIEEGTQQNALPNMQTIAEAYEVLS